MKIKVILLQIWYGVVQVISGKTHDYHNTNWCACIDQCEREGRSVPAARGIGIENNRVRMLFLHVIEKNRQHYTEIHFGVGVVDSHYFIFTNNNIS